jgi:hypothetical protein
MKEPTAPDLALVRLRTGVAGFDPEYRIAL